MYGTPVAGMSQDGDKYGFINENEVRIGAGITLVLALTAIFIVVLRGQFLTTFWIMIPLWFDFLIKVTIGPKYSPILALVRCFIKKDPVWVGAVQKRFAWGIGLFISTFVAFCLIVLSKIFYTFGGVFSAGYDAYVKNTASFQPLADSIMQVPLSPPILLCILCCIFMWLEAIVGYCVGCKIYGFLVRKKWLKEYPRQNCSDGSCSIN